MFVWSWIVYNTVIVSMNWMKNAFSQIRQSSLGQWQKWYIRCVIGNTTTAVGLLNNALCDEMSSGGSVPIYYCWTFVNMTKDKYVLMPFFLYTFQTRWVVLKIQSSLIVTSRWIIHISMHGKAILRGIWYFNLHFKYNRIYLTLASNDAIFI